MTNTTTPIPPEDERRGLGRILLTVFGSVGALVALALLVAAAALGIAHTQRDPNGPLYRNPRGETAPPQPLGPCVGRRLRRARRLLRDPPRRLPRKTKPIDPAHYRRYGAAHRRLRKQWLGRSSAETPLARGAAIRLTHETRGISITGTVADRSTTTAPRTRTATGPRPRIAWSVRAGSIRGAESGERAATDLAAAVQLHARLRSGRCAGRRSRRRAPRSRRRSAQPRRRSRARVQPSGRR